MVLYRYKVIDSTTVGYRCESNEYFATFFSEMTGTFKNIVPGCLQLRSCLHGGREILEGKQLFVWFHVEISVGMVTKWKRKRRKSS